MMPKARPRPKSDKTRHILSVPMTAEQRADLDALAGAKPLSAYVRERLFAANDNNAAPTKTARRKRTRKEEAALSTALAVLGETAQAMRSLRHDIACGIRPLSPDTEASILNACADIDEMKALLMKGLGIRER